ncbi:hypothetical protein [Mycobacterium sp. E2479]|uniref:hypothetical protein n=1 Tax=Mycobacterium sp. E2479 TaxID=1834134 RepID=UPI0008023A93|nr:hypothetical protein [Mycobacterium sp. E2479]OBH56271.1 hypothetical protein A5686_04715 [Mycobacterium sp. E2479]
MAAALTRLVRLNSRTLALFALCWGGLLVLLLVRNRGLFAHAVYEAGDPAANSILTLQAKHFTLLTGHYSRVGFHHPGPAFFYVQAGGEWLLHDLTHVVPAAYNGQAIAIMALNAALTALALTIVYTWVRSVAALLAAAGITLIFLAAHPQLVCSTWMPHVCFAPFLLYVFAVASVAAGRLRHLWIMVLAGGLLVHGHAEFLLLVPLIALAALLPQRRRLLTHRRELLIASGVFTLFLLPMVLNVALHWPGEIPQYLAYGHRAPNPPVAAARFLAQFWGPGPTLGAVFLVVLFAADLALVRRLAPAGVDGAVHEFSRHLLRVTALATALFAFYCWYGVDHLWQSYIGVFSYALPLALLILGSSALIVLAVSRPEPVGPRLAAGTAAGSLAVGVVFALTTDALRRDQDELTGVPIALDYLAAHARGKPIVLETRTDESWADALALLDAVTREGQRACLAQDRWRLQATPQFICTPQEIAAGARFTLSRVDPVSPGTPVVSNLNPIPASYPASAIIAAG